MVAPGTEAAGWSPFDLFLHTFLAVNPLVLGVWIFSLAPLVGGNVLLGVLLAGVVMLVGAVVFGALSGTYAFIGGDYAWQTRLLHRPTGAVLSLAAWWLAVATLAPVYGNILLFEVVQPILAQTGADGLASWFRGRDGVFAASLIAIATTTLFAAAGLRRAALTQRALAAIGAVSFAAVLVLLLTHDRRDFARAFDSQATEIYGAGPNAFAATLRDATLATSVRDLDPRGTLLLVPALLLYALWIGWAAPLAGDVRNLKRRSAFLAYGGAAILATGCSLVVLIGIGRTMGWQWWNAANHVYWGTVYGTTETTPLGAWPHPVELTGWLVDSEPIRIALLVGMAAWVVGWTATLFLPATRVLAAAAADGVLPARFARAPSGSVPTSVLALLVYPACLLAALDAYWDELAGSTGAVVLALAISSAGSATAAAHVFRRHDPRVAAAAALFLGLVLIVVGAWLVDPVYGVRGAGEIAYIAVLYAVVAGVVWAGRRRRAARAAVLDDPG